MSKAIRQSTKAEILRLAAAVRPLAYAAFVLLLLFSGGASAGGEGGGP